MDCGYTRMRSERARHIFAFIMIVPISTAGLGFALLPSNGWKRRSLAAALRASGHMRSPRPPSPAPPCREWHGPDALVRKEGAGEPLSGGGGTRQPPAGNSPSAGRCAALRRGERTWQAEGDGASPGTGASGPAGGTAAASLPASPGRRGPASPGPALWGRARGSVRRCVVLWGRGEPGPAAGAPVGQPCAVTSLGLSCRRGGGRFWESRWGMGGLGGVRGVCSVRCPKEGPLPRVAVYRPAHEPCVLPAAAGSRFCGSPSLTIENKLKNKTKQF